MSPYKKRLKCLLLIIFTLPLAQWLFSSSVPASQYPPATTSRAAVAGFAEAFIRFDGPGMAFYMHPTALKEFKETILLMGWQISGRSNKGNKISLVSGATTVEQIKKMPAQHVLSGFISAITGNQTFRKKMQHATLEPITSLQPGNHTIHYFYRLNPNYYSNTHRLISITAQPNGKHWGVLLSPWLKELVAWRIEQVGGQYNPYTGDGLHDMILALGPVATEFIKASLLFKDKSQMKENVEVILANKHVHRVVLLDKENIELVRADKSLEPKKEWEKAFEIKEMKYTAGFLVLGYNAGQQNKFLFHLDCNIEAVATLVLDAIRSSIVFREKNSTKEFLQLMVNMDTVEGVQIQWRNKKKWVAIGSTDDPSLKIMAMEVEPARNNRPPTVLFIYYR